MKTQKIHIKFRTTEDFFKEVKSSLSSKVESKDQKNELYFDSTRSFHNFFTHTKIDILVAIKNLNPKSIYELSKVLNRPFSAVLKDINTLTSIGFTKLTEIEGDKRKSKKPELSFDYSLIVVHKDKLAYSINIPEAA